MRILFVLLLAFLVIGGCQTDHYSTTIDAKVLTMNNRPVLSIISQFFEGDTTLLSKTDVGISFKICGQTFNEDLKLKPVEVATIKDSETIPITMSVCIGGACSSTPVRIHYGSRQLKSFSMNLVLREKLIECMTPSPSNRKEEKSEPKVKIKEAKKNDPQYDSQYDPSRDSDWY